MSTLPVVEDVTQKVKQRVSSARYKVKSQTAMFGQTGSGPVRTVLAKIDTANPKVASMRPKLIEKLPTVESVKTNGLGLGLIKKTTVSGYTVPIVSFGPSPAQLNISTQAASADSGRTRNSKLSVDF